MQTRLNCPIGIMVGCTYRVAVVLSSKRVACGSTIASMEREILDS